ncbi:hypothetical protein H2200_002971 [Cladophialophora chaetospira]|uniref:SnoaL-like domain-containing protein n=1 Tax=Cladophialophora chaetospira TaxID=386627 RepID=A0AA38XGG6_9EURO|nr:hypothetical protein H2200_002971 [Cladophialophora chaetospira]
MPTREQLLETAKRYVDAHNSRNVEAIRACCSPSSTHRGGPSSVNGPDRTRDEYVAFNADVFKMLHSYHAELTDAIVDPETRKVAMFLHAKATADAGEYENEYIITVTMTEDGKLVQDQYDFIDSHTMLQWIQKVGQFAQETWEKK